MTFDDIEKRIDNIADRIEKQLNALNDELYRITVVPVDKKLIPNTYEIPKEQILRREFLKFLDRRNKIDAANIYITPLERNNMIYFLLDDVSAVNYRQLRRIYNICTCVETSADNYQLIIKIQKDRYYFQEHLNMFFRLLNKNYGDIKISGQRHSSRLVGFLNRKPVHCKDGKYPLVKLITYKDQTCPVLKQELDEFILEISGTNINKNKINKITDTNNYVKKYHIIMKKKYQNKYDASVVDFWICKNLIRQGKSDEEIKNALITSSPDIELRHKNVEDYVERTLKKAKEEIKYEQEQKKKK